MWQALCSGNSCSSFYHHPLRALCGAHYPTTRFVQLPRPSHRIFCSALNKPSTAVQDPPLDAAAPCDDSRKRVNPRAPPSDIEEIRRLRWKKAEDLRSSGCEPYAYSWNRTHTALQLQNLYTDLGNGEEANKEEDNVSVAGRVMARRAFGKLTFLTLRDESNSIQLYCEKNVLSVEKYEQLKGFLDVGDIVGASGTIKRTEKGELSVKVIEFSILTKSLLPLPDKWHGLTDIEKRYRQR